jgi:hypothetical protein
MVTKKPKGLGMGLEALLGPKVSDAPATGAGQPTELPLDKLRAGKYQPRTRMDEGSLYELAESIRSQGVMQPILVRPVGAGHYEIIAGERRYRAARLAGLATVPVLVKEVADEAAAVMALIENIQREDLNPLEEAQGPAAPGQRFQAHARTGCASRGPQPQRGQQPAAPAQPGRPRAADADGRRPGHGPCTCAAGAARRTAGDGGARDLGAQAQRARSRTPGHPRGAVRQARFRRRQDQAARHPAAGRTPGRCADRRGGHSHQAPHTPRRRRRDRDRLRLAGRTERSAGKARRSDS